LKPKYAKLTDKDVSSYFCKSELAQIYSISGGVVSKRLDGDIPYLKLSGTDFYHLSNVSELMDFRKKDNRSNQVPEGAVENQWGVFDPNTPAMDDPDQMSPAERRLWYQSEDLRQSMLLKERKNAVEERQLIPAQEVEMTLAAAFKAVALTLDTLPDALERDGVISSKDIERIINILDGSREGLANTLSDLSPLVRTLQEEYDV